MKKLLILPLVAIGLVFSQVEPEEPGVDREVKLPNGRSQQEEILKADFKKTLEDAAELVKLAEQLQDDLIKDDRHVLDLHLKEDRGHRKARPEDSHSPQEMICASRRSSL